MSRYSLEDNLYYRVIQYGHDNPNGFTFPQLKNDLELSDEQIDLIHKQFERKQLFTSKKEEIYIHDDIEKVWLDIESEFRLLNYVQLNETRENATKSISIAVFAIALNIIAIIIQIITAY